MKQLLIVNSTAALNAKNPSGSVTGKDLSGLKPGAIAFGEIGASSVLSGPATKNFWIALGRPNGQVPFLIPEVDIRTLSIVKSAPVAATTFAATFTVHDPADVTELIPTTSRVISPINEYGIVLIKKGAVPHERNTWTVQVQSQSDSAIAIAAALAKAVNDKSSDLFPFIATTADSDVTVTCLNTGEDWDIKFIDCLEGFNKEKTYTYTNGIAVRYSTPESETTVTLGHKAIGDKADIQDLASRCAAGKGFTDTNRNGDTIYPGYPETVEDTTYNVYTLRFRVGRDSAKTRDERVWQIVHVAVPVGATAASAIAAILPEGKFEDTVMNAIAEEAAAGD